MQILYFDCFSGISGDMTVGALRDLGVEESIFHNAIAALGLENEIHVHFERAQRQNISGAKFHVHSHDAHSHDAHSHDAHSHDAHSHDAHSHDAHSHGAHSHDAHSPHHHGRTYREIRELLERSTLTAEVKVRAQSVFRRVAVAEAKIHGIAVEEIGFHEVGAADSIGDIVAACAGIEALGPVRIEASVLVEGTGWIECAHGRFPLPAPATLEILTGIPIRQVDEAVEFITPTGAALLAEYATRFGPMSEMQIERTGYGVGTRDTPPRPNVLRAILGTSCDHARHDEAETDEISQIETNLDDITPELAGAAMQSLFKAGALDVFFTPAQMKKNRPGFVLTVLCRPELADEMARLLLTETSAFGVRIHSARRQKLRCDFRDVVTPYGPVRIKLGYLGDTLAQAAPEFESCRDIAAKAGASTREVHLAAFQLLGTLR